MFRIEAREIVCKLQHVEIEEPAAMSEEQTSADEAFFAPFNLTGEEEMSTLKKLLLE